MKKFTFKYDPQHSVSKMFDEMEQAVKIKTRSIQPKNVVITNNVEVIYQALNKSRLDLYSYLVAKQPNSVAELSNLLKREPAEVVEDLNMLVDLGIVRLTAESKPIALYEKVVIEFPVLIGKEPVDRQPVAVV